MAKKKKKSSAEPPSPPTLEEIEQRKAEIQEEGYEFCSKERPPIQRRYIEAWDLVERMDPEGDCMVYDVVLRTNKHLARGALNEALYRGFSAGSKRAVRESARSVEPFCCQKCSKLAGYRVLVSVKPCPACEERKWQAEKKVQD